MTLTEMRYIVALARERHFGKAADACHVSQPTLSVALKKVEGQLGSPLFERGASDVRITPLGERIIAQATKVLEEAVKLEEIADSTGDPLSGQLRVGIIYTIAPYLLPQMIPALNREAPKMPLFLKEDFTANLIPALKAGELDVIVIALPFAEPGLVAQPVYDEPFRVVVPASCSGSHVAGSRSTQITSASAPTYRVPPPSPSTSAAPRVAASRASATEIASSSRTTRPRRSRRSTAAAMPCHGLRSAAG